MANAKLSKLSFSKSTSTIDFATEDALIDFLKMLKAQSSLPIKQMLTILFNKEADTVSCSRDDTNYSFFASLHHDVISITIKKIGEEKIEFDLPSKQIKKIEAFPQQ